MNQQSNNKLNKLILSVTEINGCLTNIEDIASKLDKDNKEAIWTNIINLRLQLKHIDISIYEELNRLASYQEQFLLDLNEKIGKQNEN